MRGSFAFGPSELPRSLPAALRDLESRKVQVRRAAARDLGMHLDSGTRGQVIQRLLSVAATDDDTEVRVQAILALADGGASESAAGLTMLAATAVPRVKQMALLALAELAAPGDADVLRVALLAISSELPALRYQGLVALRHVQGQEAVAVLTGALTDVDAEVRWVAVRLLEELTSEAADATGDEPIQAAGALELAPRLRPVLRDKNQRVATAALLLLASWGDADSLRNLVALLEKRGTTMDPDDELTTLRLLARWRVAEARPALVKRAWPLLFGGDVAFEARVALAALGDTRARQSILSDLCSGTAARCARAIEPVGRLRMLEGRDRLVQLLDEPKGLDVGAIRLALRRLTD